MLEETCLDNLLPEFELLLSDSSRFAQRAAAEAIAGVCFPTLLAFLGQLTLYVSAASRL